MSFVQTVPAALPARDASLAFKLAIAFVLAALADWLFYEQTIGISAVIFAVALACGSVIANLAGLSRSRIRLAGLILLAGLAPLVEEINVLSLIFLFLALALSLSRATNPDFDSPWRFALALRDLFLIGPFRFFRDAIGVFSLPGVISSIAVWLVPLGLGAIFVLLLGTANPVIEQWIILMSPANAASPIGVERSLFLIAATMFVWPFIQIWWRRKPASASVVPQAQEPATRPSPLLGAAAILRSLLLFNLVFAVQTVLDLIYLWGNVELPAGITYASYAHRGAYALILTALLAAGFVLAAMRPRGPAGDIKVIRPLVYVFVAQNILLVASCILRLDLYVQIYLLTYWRIAPSSGCLSWRSGSS